LHTPLYTKHRHSLFVHTLVHANCIRLFGQRCHPACA
jgi:hypothetical protein